VEEKLRTLRTWNKLREDTLASMKSSIAALFLLSFLMDPIWTFAAQPQSGTPSEVRALEPGKTLEGAMAAGDVHAYRIELEAGQFLQAVVNQRGIDLVVYVIALLRVEIEARYDGAYSVLISPSPGEALTSLEALRTADQRVAVEEEHEQYP
jgi:hypothetical protein